MPIMPDSWIRKMAAEHGMIKPFVEAQRREGVILATCSREKPSAARRTAPAGWHRPVVPPPRLG